MTQIPVEPLVPDSSLIVASTGEGPRPGHLAGLALDPCDAEELEVLVSGRAQHAHDPYGLIAASHVVVMEFATIAAANNYWR
jgi:hypothetical protein